MRAGGAKGAGGAQALKYEVQNQWGEVEKKLRQDNTPEPQVQAQRDGFFAMRGVAPESEYSAILSGRDPKTGNALTKDDVERFSRVYPLSPVDPNSLSWLKPKASTDSARSQQRGLVEPKYIRSPGPRGGYEYTESPRGLTRADYATIDAQRAPR